MLKSKKIKDLVLKSSMPLEYECANFLTDYGYSIIHEVSYIKKNENEILKDFSYDILATKVIGNIKINLMIECKYREENIKWFFLPSNKDDVSKYYFVNLIKQNYIFKTFGSNSNRKIDYDKTANALGKVVTRGTEIGGTENDSIIYKGMSQLSYGLIHEIISNTTDKYTNIFIPIIITTSNLFILNKNISIKKVKGIKDDDEFINECTQKEMIISYDIRGRKELIEYNKKEWLQYLLSQNKFNKINILFNENEDSARKEHYRNIEDMAQDSLFSIVPFPGYINIGTHGEALYKKIEAFINDYCLKSEEK